MYSYLKGEVMEVAIDSVILEVNGVGYHLFISHPQDYRRGEFVQIFCYYQVKDDGVALFGFKSKEEKELFLRLIDVKGIGPKTAINVLGATNVTNMIQAIETSNTGYLRKLPGIGPKAAQQIILDLKGKLVFEQKLKIDETLDQELLDAKDALRSLGFKVNDIDNALAKLNGQQLKAEEYIRKALKMLTIL